jgi:hypothetical protein
MPRDDLTTIVVDPEVRRALLRRGAQMQVHYGKKLSYNQILRELLSLPVEGRDDGNDQEDNDKETG